MLDRRALTVSICALALAAGLAPVAHASGGILQFQHGGRATAQAGAFTARASDASAVTYNPAAVTRLGGLQLLGGLDFSNASDDYDTPSSADRANHTIQFPPAFYLTWKPERHSEWGFGIGLDTPAWYRTDWNTALFPGRFRTRTAELRLFEVHPVASYAIDDKWSVGGGLRFLFGSHEYGVNTAGSIADFQGGGPVDFELTGLASTDVSAVSFDLAVHYDANVWGWGAVLRGPADLDESGDFEVAVRDIGNPAASSAALAAFDFNQASLDFELPLQVIGGVWVAPYPEMRVEIDLAYAAWSSLSTTDVELTSPTVAPFVLQQPRDWDDTFSLRVGVEGDLDDTWSISGGLGWEGSPIPTDTIEPGFPRGDAFVLSLGGSYNQPGLSFDLGYSYHSFESRDATGQDLFQPNVGGEYSGFVQVWSASARWKFGEGK